MEAGAATGLHAEEPLVPASEVEQLKVQIRGLSARWAADARNRNPEGRAGASARSVMAIRLAKE
jgi:hypothetical protein